MRHRSQLHLDLSLPETLPALAALHSMKSRKQKIESVLVDCGGSGSGMNYASSGVSSSRTLVGLFTLVSSLPSLTRLTVDLGDRTLPPDALLVILQVATRLEELTLRHVVLSSGEERQQGLHQVLREHAVSLRRVVLDHCSGTASIQAFLTQCRQRLTHLEVIGTKISTMGTLTAQTLVAAVVGTSLTSLKLVDVPDLRDDHIVAFSQAMVKATSQLQEFHLSSVSLGGPAAHAVVGLLQQAHVCAPRLSRVSLQLGTDAVWGRGLAEVLASPSCCTLTHLQVWISGQRQRSVDKQTIRLLRALQQNSSNNTTSHHHHRLQELHIIQTPSSSNNNSSNSSTGLEDHPTTLPLEEAVQCTLEETLRTNHTLGRLILQNESTHHGLITYDLTHALEFKLTQNRVGLSPLLYSANTAEEETNNNQTAFHQKYVSAVLQGKDDLDLVFLALSNHPSLAMNVLAGGSDAKVKQSGEKQKEATTTTDRRSDTDSVGNAPYSFLKISPITKHKFRRGVLKRFGNRRPWTAPSFTRSSKPQ